MVITPFVLDWLRRSTAVHLLHQFDQACNVVNQAGAVLSLVTPEVGPGPFTIVLPVQTLTQVVKGDAPIRIANGGLWIGDFFIDITDALLWHPQPNWDLLRRCYTGWQHQISQIRRVAVAHRSRQLPPGTAVAIRLHEVGNQVVRALRSHKPDEFRAAVKPLAGLGPGLTPAGDDFLVGLLYGLWATRPVEDVLPWARVVVETAVPLTTTLSAAWLQAAAKGEAIKAWHELGEQLAVNDGWWESAVTQILAMGHSSGADALVGFTAVTGEDK